MTDTPVLDPPQRTSGTDFAQLSRLISAAGLLRRRPGYYAVRIGLVVVAYVGCWVGFAAIGTSWWQLVTAAVMAVVFAQLALVAHDIAHRQVLGSRRASRAAGLLAGNLGIGMSYGWWMDKHTRHHANPNHSERDPDVAPDILVWTTEQASKSTGLTRVIARRQ